MVHMIVFSLSVPQLSEEGECEVGDGVIGEADSEEVKRAKLLEVEAVRAAEEGSLGDALELLNQAVTVAPNFASPYNNRAQVREKEGEGGGHFNNFLLSIHRSLFLGTSHHHFDVHVL